MYSKEIEDMLNTFAGIYFIKLKLYSVGGGALQ